jgi:spore maturation protein CgeB
MRVFLVHPGFSWASGDISLSAEAALRKLGCGVTSFDPLDGMNLFKPLFGGAGKDGLKTTEDMGLRLMCERIPLRVIEEKPDLFLAVHGARLPTHVVDAVKSLGVPTAVWLLDDPHEIDLSSRYARHYDWVFTDERMAVAAHKAAGSANVFHLPLGCDAAAQYPREVEEKYRSDVCLVGSGFAERINLLLPLQDELARFNVKLVGNWGGLPEGSKLKSFVAAGLVGPAETAKYYAGAKIVINPHRDGAGASLASNLWGVPAVSPNPRLFEAAAAGAFVLTDDKRTDSGRYFRVGEEIDTFRDGPELIEKIKYWLEREDARAAGAAAASLKARRDHSLEKRMTEVLQTAGAGVPA